MRALLFADDQYGVLVARYLADRGELIGTVVHPPHRRWSGDEIIDASPQHWQWPCDPDVVAHLERPECIVSAMFSYQITSDWLSLPSWGAINMHDGLLPYNRGRMACAWPLFDGTPAGVTLHKMVLELDAGPILAQVAMPTFPEDTAMTVYERQIEVAFELFTESWPRITELPEAPQPPGGDYHDIHEWRGLNLAESDMPTLDKLRARTFPPLGAEFTRDGKRYRVRVEIEEIAKEA
jgi:methionyl-tRNA formyltransferase